MEKGDEGSGTHQWRDLWSDALKVICKAFDDAWAHIQHHFDGDFHQAEEVRLRLAHAILAVATDTSRDPEDLKNRALQALAINYRELTAASGLARQSR